MGIEILVNSFVEEGEMKVVVNWKKVDKLSRDHMKIFTICGCCCYFLC